MIRRPPGSTLFPYTTLLPIYRGKSAQEFLAAFSDQPERSGYDLVKDYWQQRHTSADFEAWWRRSVHDGVAAGTAAAVKSVKLGRPNIAPPAAAQNLEIIFRPDPAIYDGRFANNG